MLTKLFVKASVAAQNFKKDESGVTAIEYGLIAAAIAAVVITVFAKDGSFGTLLTDIFAKITTSAGITE
ncbi:MAG: Flp family type IVb pilin [Shewanella sp.]|nr:Flp family type IVb pilin [Shewanella sp.]MCF1430173.1 Flp family type IVb pilin [Shewanella sp.]MCF1440066.1 Flp family type IVb pilin [Shewanella sp.]MCF1456251.1 Flp family type IVb pilin [Shewanella sp.]